MTEHAHKPPYKPLPNTLDTAPNLELIRLQYANGAEFTGFYSHVDNVVLTEPGAPQSRGAFYRWAPIHTTH